MDYRAHNAQINLLEGGELQLGQDKLALKKYFSEEINKKLVRFPSLKEKLDWLVAEGYYEGEVLEPYSDEFVKKLFKRCASYNFRFNTFMGALKFFGSYALKTFDGKKYLETFEDRVAMNALMMGDGDEELALSIADQIMTRRYQPATPTFLNAGKKQRGGYTSCFPAGTPVTVENGAVTPIERLKEGDRVLTHTGAFKPVTKLIRNDWGKGLFRVTLDGHSDLDCTPNHPVAVWTKDFDGRTPALEGDLPPGDEFVWFEAKDIRPGDFVLIPHPEGAREDRQATSRVTDHGVLARVTETGPKGYAASVYNLEVEDDHTYVANGVLVHNCFLIRVEDNIESINRSITDAMQLSKRGGGVAMCLTNVRHRGAPIKKMEGQSSGVVPVLKLYEDSFKYANQLGQRQGAGAAYLNAHHPDILDFLDTKKENADEATRIKTLSLGVVVPDITYHLAKKNADMYLFSPYDIERVYGKPFSDINVTEMYDELSNNDQIWKTTINARDLFTRIASLQFESGYPYVLNEDNANNAHQLPGKIMQSNLCVTGDTEILTSEGYRPAAELYRTQENISVISDERARTMDTGARGTSVQESTTMHMTAEFAEVFRVTTAEGPSIKATLWHKMYVERNGEIVKIPLGEVVTGDKLLLQSDVSANFGTVHCPDEAYLAGVLASCCETRRDSDGRTVKEINVVDSSPEQRQAISDAIDAVRANHADIADKDAEYKWVPLFVTVDLGAGREKIETGDYALFASMSLTSDLFRILSIHGFDMSSPVPDIIKKADAETLCAWLRGHMVGSFQHSPDWRNVDNGDGETPELPELLLYGQQDAVEIQKMLLTLGCRTRVAPVEDNRCGDLEFHGPTVAMFGIPVSLSTGKMYRLVGVDTADNAILEDIYYGALTGDAESGREDMATATVMHIEHAGQAQVYDVTVENGHSVIFNGIATGQCSEILQQSTPSTFKENNEFETVGEDISCNLGSMNITHAFASEDFGRTVDTAVRALTTITAKLDSEVGCSPSIRAGNEATHAIGLGQMNLHGFLAKNHIHFDSPEARDFTENYFYAVLFQVLSASNRIAKERGESFSHFEKSTYGTGEFFTPYITGEKIPEIKTDKVRAMFEDSTVPLPTCNDWRELKDKVAQYGLYHGYMQAVAPTGSISYINESTSCIHPIVAPIETRKDGTNGRVYVPMPYLADDTIPYYKTAYQIDNKAIIDIYAAAQKYVDQGMSLTLFYTNDNTTRDVVKTLIYAWTKGIKTVYYARVKSSNLSGTEVETANGFCEACQI